MTESAQGTALADLVEPGRYIASPTTTEEIAQDIRYMLSSGSNQLTLQYSGISAIQARQVMEKACPSPKVTVSKAITASPVLSIHPGA